MIDTIVLKISNLLQHDFVIERLNKAHKREGKTFISYDTKDIDGEEFNPLLLELVDHSSNYRSARYINKIYLPSSHYSMTYLIDTSKDCITFNFSIPKYIYGTNILQFVQHPTEVMTADRDTLQSNKYHEKNTYDRLIKFLKKFIKQFDTPIYSVGENLIETRKINPDCVEIERIDICYNQFFLNKEEALKYLGHQKNVRKKYIRDTANNKQDWQSSIYIKNDRYTAKIYHKGSEYKSKTGELKKHKTINNQLIKAGKLPAFDIEFLQSQADRILRYEIEYKKSFISYLFKQQLFRKDCKIHQKFKEISSKHKSIKEKSNRLFNSLEIAKKRADVAEISSIKEQLKDNHAKLKTFNNSVYSFNAEITGAGYNVNNYSITYDKISKIYNNMNSQNCDFVLDCSKYYKTFAAKTIDLNIKNQEDIYLYKTTYFSEEIFMLLIKSFKDFVKQFQIAEKASFTELSNRIDEHNIKVDFFTEKGLRQANYFNNIEEVKNDFATCKINKNRIKQIIALLDVYSLEQLVSMKLIARSTKYEFLKRMKAINYDHRNISQVKINTSTDFTSYMDMIYNHSNKFILKQTFFK